MLAHRPVRGTNMKRQFSCPKNVDDLMTCLPMLPERRDSKRGWHNLENA
jgi:hypothetical protein